VGGRYVSEWWDLRLKRESGEEMRERIGSCESEWWDLRLKRESGEEMRERIGSWRLTCS